MRKKTVDNIEKYRERTTSILGINCQQWQKLVEKAIACKNQQEAKLESLKIRINLLEGLKKPILNHKKDMKLYLFYLRSMLAFKVLRI